MLKQQVKQLVCEERRRLPRLGTRKLYFKLQPGLRSLGLKLGRDKFFAWMKEFDLLIKPRRRYVQTTMSKHHLRKYSNPKITICLSHALPLSVLKILKTEVAWIVQSAIFTG